jgi:hypothetical protein
VCESESIGRQCRTTPPPVPAAPTNSGSIAPLPRGFFDDFDGDDIDGDDIDGDDIDGDDIDGDDIDGDDIEGDGEGCLLARGFLPWARATRASYSPSVIPESLPVW